LTSFRAASATRGLARAAVVSPSQFEIASGLDLVS
jgi:hypothetical protein